MAGTDGTVLLPALRKLRHPLGTRTPGLEPCARLTSGAIAGGPAWRRRLEHASW